MTDHTTDQTTTPTTFEDAYRELGEIVNQLESGDLSLDQSITLYERGRQLMTFCESLLNNAELRINQLVSDGTDAL
jgi:exodeoxyribonuclease VII small subunit